ncbi:KAP family NTPase [Pseudomonas sp. R3.Fl]|uniref:KAP family P-loop NTPase fold protein n=1 Tax=Pseudomonas sp. R3.Fl TaxID=2928708 RepID=UPI00201DCCD7|nr:P-loop NTPase fold protein [Pseudomonas sp. R3.Fl]MCL6692107.1 KAP family NTPase [Pseudomonas sp. R3.Fl]
MRIKAAPLNIDESTGFDPKIDIFKRITIGERLSYLLEASHEGLIIGIDGAWGEGKSTFAKMLRGHLQKSREIKTIYFDAFENDYQKDPFLAIAAQIIQQTKASSKAKESFKKSALKTTKILARGALRIGIKAATAGALDETILDDLGVSDDIGEDASSALDKFLSEKLDGAYEEKEALNNFKIELEKITKAIGKGKPVTFIIDELDRCRPDYCLELLEQLKHLFSTKNLNFLIVTNKRQLLASIKKKYGAEIDSHLYLQKFIDLWLSLPRIDNEYESHPEKYIDFLIPRLLSEGEKLKNETTFSLLTEIFRQNQTSLRGIEKTLSYVSIIYNSTKNEYNDHYQVASAIVCYCKAERPEIIPLLTRSNDYSTIISEVFPDSTRESGLIDYSKILVRYCLSNEQERATIKAEGHFTYSRDVPQGNIFKTISTGVDNLKL